MQLNRLDATLAVASQLQPTDLAALHAAGFRSIICNRPDSEDAGQPPFAQIAEAAGRLGMQARYLPVLMATIAPGDGAAFGRLLAELPGPTVAYCRSGKRSATLWELSRATGR